MGATLLPGDTAEAQLRLRGGKQAFTTDDVWVRPGDWLALPNVLPTENKFVGLLAVTDDDANFLALSAAGNYTVDWGDGSAPENKNSGTGAYHQYTYSSISSSTQSSRGYRQVLVTVTPQAGQTFTSINLNVQHTSNNRVAETKWLDLVIAGSSLTTITIGAGVTNVKMDWLEQAAILSSAKTSWAYQFNGCGNLQSVIAKSSGTVTSTVSMFESCYSLKHAPMLNTSSVTNMSYMFNECYSLKTVPLYNTSSATVMGAMFTYCYSLESVPLFDTSKNVSMGNMFYQCSSLSQIPPFDTSSVTDASGAFYLCRSLQAIPSNFNISAATNIRDMFYGCSSLPGFAPLDASSATNAVQTVRLCASLARGVLLGSRVGTDYSGCSLSRNAIESIFDNLGAAYGSQTVTISTNWGNTTPVSLSGTTTSGSTTVTMASTTGLSAGMEISGTGISDAVAVTLQDSGDTFTRTAHGLSDGDRVGVLTLNGAGGGIALNTPYYVVNKTANTFQVADTAGGSAKAITATPKFSGVTSGQDSTDASTYTTASVTLTAGRLYLLSVENSHGTTATAISSITGGAGVPTFTSRRTTQFNGTTNRTSIWSAVPGSDYTGTLTINFGGTTQTGATWSLVEVVNVDTATNDGIVTSNSATGSSTTPSVTASALGASTNALFGAVGTLQTSATPVGRYTEIHDVTATTPQQGLQTIYQSVVSETIDRTVSSTITSAAWGICYVEVKAGTATADGAGTINYSTTISSIVTNTSVTLSVPASASGTITTSSALLKRSKARIHGFTVSG